MPQKKRTAKPRKKASKDKPILPYLLIGLALALIIIAALELNKRLKINNIKPVDVCQTCGNATAPISSTTRLNDLQPEQLLHAKRNGLRTIFATNDEFREAQATLVDEGKLVYLETNSYFHIKKLTHSHPYLTNEAAFLLQDICRRFQQKTAAQGLPTYKILVTSLLRTEENQKNLTRRNANATKDQTCHLYGTTFDISYQKFVRNGLDFYDQRLTKILEETLREMRSECRMLIKRESRRSRCYHMTVVKKKIGGQK